MNKHLVKEDGSAAKAGESLDLVVLDFSKSDKKIVLSHTATFSEVEEDKPVAKKKSNKSSKPKQEAEKSTLGDLDALAAMKKKMQDGE